jgi:protein phosphatase 1 regulatory subunit 7
MPNRTTKSIPLAWVLHGTEPVHCRGRAPQAFESLSRLRVLDVANNRIESLPPLAPLPRLTDLWLNDNRIGSLEAALHSLAAVRGSLTCLYLAGNPAADVPGYRAVVRGQLPALEQLDDAVA